MNNFLKNYPRLSGKTPLPALRKKAETKPTSPFGMWGSRIGGKKGMPLDLGVTLAGMLAHSIAPDEWGGRMGKDLASLGGTMYGQRMMHGLGVSEREFARKEASALAKSRMAEVERRERGSTKRAELAEAGRATRGVATETGKEARHLREFGPEGVRTRESTLRYAPGGLVERGQERTATSAAGRLSEVIEKREKEEGLKLYEAETESLFEPYIERGPEGEATLPTWLRKLYLEGEVKALDDPKKAQAFLRKGIAKHEEDVESESYLDSLSEMPLSELKRLREQMTFYPITREGRLSEAR